MNKTNFSFLKNIIRPKILGLSVTFIFCSFSYAGLSGNGVSKMLAEEAKCKKVFKANSGVLNDKIFGKNDIRGIFETDFDFRFSKTLADATSFLWNKRFSASSYSPLKVVIGFDARKSSHDLADMLATAFVKNGAIVSVAGLVPTPFIYSFIHDYDYTLGVIVTASHSPIDHNGFKMMFNKKYTANNMMPEIQKIIQGNDLIYKQSNNSRNIFSVKASDSFNYKAQLEVVKDLDPVPLFVGKKDKAGRAISLNYSHKIPHYLLLSNLEKAHYINSLKQEFPNLKPLPFVVDTGNGAAGPLVKEVFATLGLNPHYLFTTPDGNFPNHHPDPTIDKNLVSIKKKVAETNSLFGIAFDGDGDRLIVVTAEGKAIRADEFAYMFLPTLLNTPGVSKELVIDVKVSDWYHKKAKNLGANVTMVPSGYTFLREKMRKLNASLAMEFSGHIMFNDRPNRGFDDALYNALRFIELIGNNKGDIKSLLPDVKTVNTTEIRLEMESDEITQAMDNIKNYLKNKQEQYMDIDGIRLTRGNSWALIRSSNTESVLSLRFEAGNKEGLTDFMEELTDAMNIKIPEDEIIYSE